MEILKSQLARLHDLLPEDVMKQVYAAGKRSHYSDGELIQQRGDTHQGF